jgi:hypothetical protein
MAIPGHPSVPEPNDLIAVWKTIEGERFQNYRACFTILDEAAISRDWIHSVGAGIDGGTPPKVWEAWVQSGFAKPLQAPRTHPIRSKSAQLPKTDDDLALLRTIYEWYAENPIGFEACAGVLAGLLLRDVSELSLTRPWRDGGRDAIGRLRLGKGAASIEVTFALEAKCYSQSNSVGVREVSRLISRIKHREFGVLVTTSFVDRQAYAEVVEDGHPVILVTGDDIVRLLRTAGYDTPQRIVAWLDGLDKVGR